MVEFNGNNVREFSFARQHMLRLRTRESTRKADCDGMPVALRVHFHTPQVTVGNANGGQILAKTCSGGAR